VSGLHTLHPQGASNIWTAILPRQLHYNSQYTYCAPTQYTNPVVWAGTRHERTKPDTRHQTILDCVELKGTQWSGLGVGWAGVERSGLWILDWSGLGWSGHTHVTPHSNSALAIQFTHTPYSHTGLYILYTTYSITSSEGKIYRQGKKEGYGGGIWGYYEHIVIVFLLMHINITVIVVVDFCIQLCTAKHLSLLSYSVVPSC
jgi:hypothetical protein